MLSPILRADQAALLWINSHHNAWLDAILVPVSYAGDAGAVWIVVGLGLLVFGRGRHRTTGLVLLVSLFLVDRLVSMTLAHFFFRERPYVALEGVRQIGPRWGSSSFPSAHAHSVWIATLLLSSEWRKLTAPLVVFALLTMYSRPYVGMHYPGDVLVGAVVGIGAGFAIVYTRGRLERAGRVRRRTPA